MKKTKKQIKRDEAILKARWNLLSRAKNINSEYEFKVILNACEQFLTGSKEKHGGIYPVDQKIIDIADINGKDMTNSCIKHYPLNN